MFKLSHAIFIGLLSFTFVACESVNVPAPSPGSDGSDRVAADADPPRPRLPLAYLSGKRIDWVDIDTMLLEAAGRDVLVEVILDIEISQRLKQRGETITPADLDREKTILRDSLSDDPDQAARILPELRRERGWGEQRFEMMLKRNAGLRKLVADQVAISPAALDQAYQFLYGPRYELRLITVPDLSQATKVRNAFQSGQSFTDLAIEYSTDASRAQGGWLGAISPVDATYPDSIRKAIAGLDVGQVSAAIPLEQGYALIRLEGKIPAKAVRFDDVKDQLTADVRQRVERALMQQLAREIVAGSDLVIFDPTLNAIWKQYKQQLTEQ